MASLQRALLRLRPGLRPFSPRTLPLAPPCSVRTALLSSAASAPAPSGPGGSPAPAGPGGSLLQAYGELCKARLSSLVVITSGAGFLLAGTPVDWPCFAAAVGGTALAAASANTFNQVSEAPLDALMKRTQGRPLPTGRLSRPAALAFGGGAALASLGVLLAGTNPLTAALGMGNIALYALVYTPLKQLSTLNTAVGAVVGAVPPLMGWAAATGSLAAVDPFLLAYILFAWQFPHFYALAWGLRKDYARGGYRMVPVFDATGAHTARLILRHTLVLSALPLLSTVLGVTSPMFALEGLLLNGYLLRLALAFRAAPSDAGARAIFRASLWYLPLVAGLFVFHANLWLPLEAQVQLDALVGAAPPGGEAAAAARGTSWGEAAENAVASARLLGRELCLHELLAPSGGAGGGIAAAEAGAGAGAGLSSGAGACPVVIAETVAGDVASAAATTSKQAQAAAAAASAAVR
jgi:protoheme IX farnesyltransferase